jgi:hypothetical protein
MTRRASFPTVILNAVGFALLVAGWVAVSGRVTLADQAPYLNLALAGLLLAGIGNGLYIMATRRTLENRLRHVHDRMSGVTGP